MAKLFLYLATLHEPAGRVIKKSQWAYFVDSISEKDPLLKKVRPFMKYDFFEVLKNDKDEIELQDFRHGLVRLP